MGVILFIMVTGSLPYLGEANIRDPLYQFIKTKQPDSFWQQWTQYFRSQEEEKDKDITFSTTDDEEIILDEEDDCQSKSITFQIWIQLLL